MAKRHVEEYFLQVCNQYNEMLDNLKELEQEANTGMIEPERLDNFKKIIEPLKNNYMTLSWIMFLLNKPNRESKGKKYASRMQTKTATLDNNYSKDNVIRANGKVLHKLRNGGD